MRIRHYLFEIVVSGIKLIHWMNESKLYTFSQKDWLFESFLQSIETQTYMQHYCMLVDMWKIFDRCYGMPHTFHIHYWVRTPQMLVIEKKIFQTCFRLKKELLFKVITTLCLLPTVTPKFSFRYMPTYGRGNSDHPACRFFHVHNFDSYIGRATQSKLSTLYFIRCFKTTCNKYILISFTFAW